jgi:hypothetical protein
MSDGRRKCGNLRARVADLLQSADFEEGLADGCVFPPRRVVSPLLSFLYATDDLVKWRAVAAIGIVVACMADDDMEAGRCIMRRLIWNLNDESGGVGWGSPEAMGEIMAMHEGLANEFYRILLSYIQADGNPLENELLERGVLWGLGRLAQVRPHLLREAAASFFPYLTSADPIHRGMAAWALGFLDGRPPEAQLKPLLDDHAEIGVYEDGEARTYRISDLAERLSSFERSGVHEGISRRNLP